MWTIAGQPSAEPGHHDRRPELLTGPGRLPRSPDETFQITPGAGTVVATGIHRFWRAGKGWTMAHDLKPGNLVRTVGGLVAVNAVADD